MSVVPVTHGHHYFASTGHELATLAAFEALENGGNAIDAGVAAILTLGVVYSDQVSIAGVAPMIVRLAETGEVVTIAGVGGWPRALDAEAFIERHGGTIPLGVRRTVVPAAPDACIQALERWGTMTFRDVAARAVRYASHGFPRHPVMLDYVRKYADEFRQWPENAAIWMPGGEVPAPGERLVQADLGRVLQFLCDEERAAGDDRRAGLAAVRHAFYRGDIARRILAHQKEHDGLLAANDWSPSAARSCLRSRAVSAWVAKRSRVHTCGAWCQGSVPARSAFHRRGGGRRRAGVRHGCVPPYDCRDPQARVRRQGRLSRRPGFRGHPSRYALGRAYAAERCKAIDPRKAFPGMPRSGRIPGHEAYVSPVAASDAPAGPSPDTSIVCVIDGQGNALCSTPSDTSWDTPVVPGTGLAVSSRGDQSWAMRGHPSCLAPGKRPRLTPNPCFGARSRSLDHAVRDPGGDTQIQANLQFLLNRLAFGMALQDAVEAPRLVTHSHPNSFAPHAARPGLVTLEDASTRQRATGSPARGHRVERLDDWFALDRRRVRGPQGPRDGRARRRRRPPAHEPRAGLVIGLHVSP